MCELASNTEQPMESGLGAERDFEVFYLLTQLPTHSPIWASSHHDQVRVGLIRVDVA